MGFFKDLGRLNQQAKEVSKDWDPAAQMRQAMAGMSQVQDMMAQTSAAASIGPNGKLATAQITASRDTGAIVNHQPILEIDLLVMPDDGAPFPATVRQVVPLASLGRVTPGGQLQVTYDPANPTTVLASI